MGESTVDVWRMLDTVLHPRLRDWEKLFTGLNFFVIVCVFSIPLALSTPLLSSWAYCEAAAKFKHWVSREVAIQMCDWFSVLFQLAIFVAIGGIAFTQRFATDLEKKVAHVTQSFLASQYQSDEEGAALRESERKEMLKILRSPGVYKEKVKQILGVMGASVHITNDVVNRYAIFAVRGMALKFPGGLYGFIGFLVPSLPDLRTLRQNYPRSRA